MTAETTAQSIGIPPCVACGGVAAWSATRQQLVCRSCGAEIPMPPPPTGGAEHFSLLPRLRDRPDSGRDWQPRATHLRCRSCQSIIVFDPHIVGGTCQACGTPGLVPSDESGAPVNPSGVLPFRVSEADARQKLADWLRTKRARGIAVDTVQSVYAPCWVFNASVSCRWRGEIRRRDSDGNEERVGIDGIVERTFDDYLIPASGSIARRRFTSAGPFPVSDMLASDARYLAGWTVEIYTTNMWDAWDAASGKMERELDAELREDSKCPPSELETWPEWRDQRCAHVLVPLHLITCRRGKDAIEATVNGWNGAIDATLPISWLAVVTVLVVLLALAGGVAYGLYWLLS
jgi:hypothetical protein